MRAQPQQQRHELQSHARGFLTKTALCYGGSKLRLVRQHGTHTVIPPKTQNVSSSPGSARGPVRAQVTDAQLLLLDLGRSAECFYRGPHACLNWGLPLPDLKLKQSADFGLRLDERLPEGTKAVRRPPLAVLSALSLTRDDCASTGGCRAASEAIFLLMKLKTEEVQPACSHAEFPWYIPKRRLLIPLTWLDFHQCENTLPMQVVPTVLFGCSRGSHPFFISCVCFVNGVCHRRLLPWQSPMPCPQPSAVSIPGNALVCFYNNIIFHLSSTCIKWFFSFHEQVFLNFTLRLELYMKPALTGKAISDSPCQSRGWEHVHLLVLLHQPVAWPHGVVFHSHCILPAWERTGALFV